MYYQCNFLSTLLARLTNSNPVQEISDDVTTPGLLRPLYTSRSRVNDCVIETQRAVSQVKFSGAASGARHAGAPVSGDAQTPPSHVTAQSIFSPPLGSDITVNASGYSPQYPVRPFLRSCYCSTCLQGLVLILPIRGNGPHL